SPPVIKTVNSGFLQHEREPIYHGKKDTVSSSLRSQRKRKRPLFQSQVALTKDPKKLSKKNNKRGKLQVSKKNNERGKLQVSKKNNEKEKLQ
ncbi:15892_t:CDS:2, partial [Dentiscutata heterogama]